MKKRVLIFLMAAFLAINVGYAQQIPKPAGITAKQSERSAATVKQLPAISEIQLPNDADLRGVKTNSFKHSHTTPILRVPKNVKPSISEEIPSVPRFDRGSTAYAYMHQSATSGAKYGSFNTDNFFPVTTVSTQLPGFYGGGAYNGTLYAYFSDIDVSSEPTVTDVTFYRVNAQTGAIIGTTQRPELYGNVIDAVCYDFSQNVMYAIITPDLYTVNLTTGALTQVATITGIPGDEFDSYIFGMAIDLYGTMYAITPGTSKLWTINKTTGAATLVGATGVENVNYAQSIAFDYTTGKLYWHEMHEVDDLVSMNYRQINVTTGASSIITTNTQECTSFFVPYEYNGEIPQAVKNLTATPGAAGALNVTLNWTNPSLNIAGNPLTDLTAVKIYENGTLIQTINNPTVGGTGTYTRTVTTGGNYTYKVVAENAAGTGVEKSVTVWIGIDLPGAPSNIVLARNGWNATLTWEAPTTGMHGGYYSPTGLKYDVYRNGTTLVASNTTTLSYTEQITIPNNYFYKIVAKNENGTGASANSKLMNFKGEVANFPWSEKYNDVNFPPYGWDQFKYGTYSSVGFERYDLYGLGNLPLYHSAPACAGHWCDLYASPDTWLVTPPIRLSSTSTMQLELWSQIWFAGWFKNGENSIWISTGSNDPKSGDFVLLKKWTSEEAYAEYGTSTNPNWKFHKLFLDGYEGQTVHIAFHYTGADAHAWFIDDIRVNKVPEHDLKTTLHGPISLPTGVNGDFTIQVDNLGINTETNYTIKLSRRVTDAGSPNVLIGTVTGNPIAPGETQFYKITWVNPTVIMNYYMTAEVILDGDDDPDNNIIDDYFCSTTIPTENVWTYKMDFEQNYDDWQSWTVVDRSTASKWWHTQAASDGEAYHLDWFMYYTSGHDGRADDWMFTPKIYFDGTKAYKISFWMNVDGPEGFVESAAFYHTNGFTPEDVIGEPLWINKKIINHQYEKIEVTVAGLEGLHIFATHCFSPQWSYNLLFDYFIVEEIVTVAGNVTSASTPVEGAQVQVTGNPYKTYSDATGHYVYGVNSKGNYQFKASKVGYFDDVKTVNITANNQVVDFNLTPRPIYTVSGKVIGNNTGGVGIAGAKVTLSGYDNYEATTDANGNYTITGVFDGFTYTVNATATGRMPYTGEATINAADVTHNITMMEPLYPVAEVTVTAVDAANPNAIVNWTAPNGMLDKIYVYDDGSMEDGYSFWPGTEIALGNKYPLPSTENGVLTGVDLYSWAYPQAGPERLLTVKIYDADRNYVGQSAPFRFDQKETQWFHVALPNIPFSGEFYAMVCWTGEGYDMTNFLGYDKTGSHVNDGLDWFIAYDTWYHFEELDEYSLYPSVFGIRVHANSYFGKGAGKSVMFDLSSDELVTEENGKDAKAFTGYNLYRGLKGTSVSGWTQLKTNTTELTYTDNNVFTSLTPAVYQYAVKTVYTGDYTSTAILSNDMPVNMIVPFTVKITTNDGIPPTGALVTLTNQNDEVYTYNATSNATGVTFNNIWRGTYSIKITLPGYAKHIASNIDITQDNTPVYTVNLTEMLYPVDEVNWTIAGSNMLITWSEAGGNTGTTYKYDDDSFEYGWLPGGDMHIGGKFPVTESGEITSVDIYGIYEPYAGQRRISIDIYNAQQQLIGSSEKVTFNQMENGWYNITLPEVSFSGAFYAMIHWHSGFGTYTNYVGVDEDGPYANSNLDYVRTPEGQFELLHNYWGEYGASPCVVMIRVNAISMGKSVTYTPSNFRTLESTTTRTEVVTPALSPERESMQSTKVGDPVKNTRSLTGYHLYRLIEGQPESSWVMLGSNLSGHSYTDEATLVNGTNYYWAVKAVYTNDAVSAPRFSPVCPFGKIANVTLTVKTNSGDPVNGARLSLAHSDGKPEHTYIRTLNANTITLNNVYKGNYKITVSLNGFETYTANNVSINQDNVTLNPITLIEIINTPFNLEMKQVNACTQVFSWNNLAGAEVTLSVPTDVFGDGSGYQMWLDANASTYNTTNPIASCSSISPSLFSGYQFSIPDKAYPACEYAQNAPANWVFMNSKSIQVTPGTYDFLVVNPEVGASLWGAGGEYGRYDNFEFEAGKHYTFTVALNGNQDDVTLSVQDTKGGSGEKGANDSRSFLGYRVYLDNVEVAITKSTEFQFMKVPAGNHTAGVQAIYTSGVSEIVSINFASTCTDTNLPTYTITSASNNTDWGTVTGGGDYKMYETVSVKATAKAGYEFKYWQENGEWTSYSKTYEFAAMKNRALVAVFGTPSGVDENVLSNVVLYPNPFANEIRISNPDLVKSVEITNITGQKVKHVIFNGSTISAGELGAGIYFITIESFTGEKVTHKMVKVG